MKSSLPPAGLRIALLLSLAVLAACSKQEEQAPAATSTDTPVAPAVDASAAEVEQRFQGMSVEQLREAASKALAENRIYAPGGDNAVEYYLAVAKKAPNDASVRSALTDLLPYTVIAAEQAMARERFDEVQRLVGLIESVDAKAPALARLKESVVNGQAAVAQREVDAAKNAEEAAKLAEERRLAAMKAEAEQRVAQQQAAQQLAAQQAAAEQARQQEAARAAAEREQAARAAAAQPAAPTPAAPSAAAPAAVSLRAVSTPAPRYPPEALRAGTSGQVVVELTIAPDGSVSAARVVRADPARVFDREALNAVRRWKFAPIPTTTTTRRTINFNPG